MTDKDREAFEAWCNQRHFGFQFTRGIHSLIYDNSTEQDMWISWQAARDHYAPSLTETGAAKLLSKTPLPSRDPSCKWYAAPRDCEIFIAALRAAGVQFKEEP